MKLSYLRVWILALLLGIAPAISGLGGSKSKTTRPPVSPSLIISGVTTNSVTISESKAAKTLTVSPFTEITLNGQRATIADLKPGMTVSVTLGTDPTHASRINAIGK